MSIQRRRLRFALAMPMLGILALPLIALALSARPGAMANAMHHPDFWPALWLSLRTSVASLVLVVLLGTPVAWFLARARSRWASLAELVVELPVVLPPSVVGLALLLALGQRGLGLNIAFSTAAVILAQTVVAAPLYIQVATASFRRLDDDLVLVAQTLGATPAQAFIRVTLPLCMPGLVSGIALAWARALGEFGATLLFAGNLRGVSQTMPLAIYAALEHDVSLAIAFALVLTAAASMVLGLARLARQQGQA